MIKRKPVDRLGYNGPAEIKAHPWLSGFAWDELENKKLAVPFIPSVI